MYKSIDVAEFLLQSSLRNPVEFYYNWIVILCIIYDVRWIGSILWAVYEFMCFVKFYIQWHCFAKKGL
jgi:hypothetical protein